RLSPPLPSLIALRWGSIIPDAENVIVPFKAKNLNFVDIRVKKIYQNNVLQFLQHHTLDEHYGVRYVGNVVYENKIDLKKISREDNRNQEVKYNIDLKKMIATELGAIYKVYIGYRREYVEALDCDNFEEESEESKDLEEDQLDNPFDYLEEGYWNESKNPCSKRYYLSDNFIKSTLMHSNVNLIAKSFKNGLQVIATNVLEAKPIKGVNIEIYDYYKQLMYKGISDSMGIVQIYHKVEKPYFIIARYNGQYGYLCLKDYLSNSTSEFDVEGSEIKNGLNAFIYTDRGIWRPGDSIHIYCILRDKSKILPQNYPITVKVKDTHQKERLHKVITHRVGNIYHTAFETSPDDPTGNWEAIVIAGNNRFYKSLKVEAIKPNRLKIKLKKTSDQNIQLHNEATTNFEVNSKWLHGASAENLDVQVDMQAVSQSTIFKNYKNFIFDDPTRKNTEQFVRVHEGKLDSNGLSKFNLKAFKKASFAGMIKLQFKSRVIEKSGNFSEDYISYEASPFSHFVGLHIPKDNWGNYVIKDKCQISAVTLDANGKLSPDRKISLGLYNLGNSWWYEEDESNNFKYTSSDHENAIYKTDTISNQKGGLKYAIPIEEKGNYLLKICDIESGHCTGSYFSTYNYDDENQEKQVEYYNIKADKEKYKLGEKIKLSIPTETETITLVSIESNDKVLQSHLLEGKSGKLEFEIPVTKEFLPNIYIHATFIQKYNKKNNDLPIRMYGILPIKIIDEKTMLYPIVTLPSTIEPEREYQFEVKEKKGRPMYYTIAIVDEGLLDLTRFVTPDPHKHFYAKQSLGVKTWDLFDEMANPIEGKISNILSIGGDNSNTKALSNKKANRFIPIVKTYGPFYLGQSARKKHNIKINNYVGSVRAMIVASYEDMYGHGEATAYVKKPLMVQSTLPRILSIGDEFTLTSNVFALHKSIKNVTTKIETNDVLEVFSEPKFYLNFNKEEDDVCFFTIRAKKTGVGKIKIKAESNGGIYKSEEELEIDVRNPNPLVYENRTIKISKNLTEEMEIQIGQEIEESN
ncbi:MAG: hypothetical protein RLZZ546_2054, partial [Bacteroidota bacterium]